MIVDKKTLFSEVLSKITGDIAKLEHDRATANLMSGATLANAAKNRINLFTQKINGRGDPLDELPRGVY